MFEQLPPERSAVDVLEAEPQRPPRRGWVIAGIAAAVVVVLIGGFFVLRRRQGAADERE
jgi:hypothetical protein